MRPLPSPGRGAWEGLHGNPIMMEQQPITYAGMLDQSGFKQWYGYQKMRIEHQLEPDEVSFLMGKPPFYFRDYALLAPGAKLTCEDQHVLSTLFQHNSSTAIEFEKDDTSILEKRLVRVRLKPKTSAIVYQIAVPWAVKGTGNPNKLTMRQERWIPTPAEEAELRKQVDYAVKKLCRGNFFHPFKPALAVYLEVARNCKWLAGFRPAYVKEALYRQIGMRTLSLKTMNGQLVYFFAPPQNNNL